MGTVVLALAQHRRATRMTPMQPSCGSARLGLTTSQALRHALPPAGRLNAMQVTRRC